MLVFPNHVRVYVDESGDLGFGPKSSRVFVVSYLIPQNVWDLHKALSRLRKRLVGDRKFSGSEFKFSHDSEVVRKKVLTLLASKSIDIGIVAIEKVSVKHELREIPTRLYNYLVIHYMVSNVLTYSPERIEIVVDKSMHKEAQKEFNKYLQNKIGWKFLVEHGMRVPECKVIHKNSQEEVCLQGADYVAGATFRKFEHNDSSYYDLIKDKVRFKNSWGDIVW
ncbi:MAG: DUF3800 domain-containing protein [Candidatus Caldarchaeum sp.]|jgi:hypothetical protein